MKNAATCKITGEITARCYDQSGLTLLEKLWNRVHELFKLPFSLYILGDEKWNDYHKNVIANVGFEAIGQILTGEYADTGEVNYMALGTGSTAPSASDTELDTETYRNATFSGTTSGNVTYITAVYTEAEVSGTFNEFGNFIDGAAGANTGVLWSHILTGGWVKTGVDVLVVDCKYTFTSS